MTAQIIDGKMISAEVNRENAEKVAFLKSKNITQDLPLSSSAIIPLHRFMFAPKLKNAKNSV